MSSNTQPIYSEVAVLYLESGSLEPIRTIRNRIEVQSILDAGYKWLVDCNSTEIYHFCSKDEQDSSLAVIAPHYTTNKCWKCWADVPEKAMIIARLCRI